MGFQECVDFANENKVCYVGTSENNHPFGKRTFVMVC